MGFSSAVTNAASICGTRSAGKVLCYALETTDKQGRTANESSVRISPTISITNISSIIYIAYTFMFQIEAETNVTFAVAAAENFI